MRPLVATRASRSSGPASSDTVASAAWTSVPNRAPPGVPASEAIVTTSASGARPARREDLTTPAASSTVHSVIVLTATHGVRPLASAASRAARQAS